MHFGHCEEFALIDVDDVSRAVLSRSDVTPPPHQPGLLPEWLAEQGVSVVLAGGMGSRASNLLFARGIDVITGIQPDLPDQIVNDYLAGRLIRGDNVCAH